MILLLKACKYLSIFLYFLLLVSFCLLFVEAFFKLYKRHSGLLYINVFIKNHKCLKQLEMKHTESSRSSNNKSIFDTSKMQRSVVVFLGECTEYSADEMFYYENRSFK